MNKIKLYIDFDDTLVDSNLALRTLYSENFCCDIPEELVEWNGCDQFHLAPEDWVEKAFNTDVIWQHINLFPECRNILQQLKDSNLFDMQICSIGFPNNIKNKIDFLQHNDMGKYFSDYIMVTKTAKHFEMGKDFLKDGILIDDNMKNLRGIRNPILFWSGKWKNWNEGYAGHAINGWSQQSLDTIMKVALEEINNYDLKMFDKKVRCVV